MGARALSTHGRNGEAHTLRLLFVCSRNRLRSPTAERVFRGRPGIDTRSRGLAASARSRLSEADLRWADIVFVMEEAHLKQLRREHRPLVDDVEVHVLDIPDEYDLMDPELVRMLEDSVAPVLAAR